MVDYIIGADSPEDEIPTHLTMAEIKKGLEKEMRDFLPYVKNECPLFVKSTNLDSDEKLSIFLTNIILRTVNKNNIPLSEFFEIAKRKISEQEKSLQQQNQFLISEEEKREKSRVLKEKISR